MQKYIEFYEGYFASAQMGTPRAYHEVCYKNGKLIENLENEPDSLYWSQSKDTYEVKRCVYRKMKITMDPSFTEEEMWLAWLGAMPVPMPVKEKILFWRVKPHVIPENDPVIYCRWGII